MLELYQHQQDALSKALQRTGFALFMDPGTGKTRIAIELIKHYNSETLIICPLSVIESVWLEELAKWYPTVTAKNLWRRKNSFDFNYPGIGIINFESATKLPKQYWDTIKFLIIDESSKIKNPSTKITKFLCGTPSGRSPGMADNIPYRLIMSGTPAPNSPIEYWSQMRLISPCILGENFYAFRATYFYNCGYGGYLWKLKKGIAEKITDKIRPFSYYANKADCLDLPEQVFMSKKYQMEPEQLRHYKEMYQENITEIKGRTVIGANELAKIMKLRQITSGFIIHQGAPILISEGKLKLLQETIEEIGDKKIIIWCQFRFEIQEIKKLLESMGLGFVALYGDIGQTEKEANIKAFQDEDSVKVLIAHPKSGGHGLNFSGCSYNIYYSLDYSYEGEKQSQDRTHRIGQVNKVTYIYLLAEKSIDEKIFSILRKKENVSESILAMINADINEEENNVKEIV